ncbi:MAG TPA: isovaleryl-CoA dehydrogenase [Myxococcaceae bacterium]|nr:isovaleryl-CoA dehydrogenase [Myxococcaceae bacterium]
MALDNPYAKAFTTHEVENQVPPLSVNVWETDTVLREAVLREGGGWAEQKLSSYGKLAGGEMAELAQLANVHKPELLLFDRAGHRLDEVRFHPSYHRLMGLAIEHGVHNLTWTHAEQEGANVARMGLFYLHNQADSGTSCPLTMTYASVPAIRHQPDLAETWVPRILSGSYDPVLRPADRKSGVTVGMGMTEKQGGSDVRSNATRAYPLEQPGPGRRYALVGHKWFFSAPMSDLFLVLAQTDAGISCFLLPRHLPEGPRNAIRIQRLKDKLGDWSNASSEVEFQGAEAFMVGAEGRGIATILEMVSLTRQDCMIGSSAQMRQALIQAIHHARHRAAFGKRLSEQPLMQNVLADLALESEAHTALSARLARAVGHSGRDAHEAALSRVVTAIGKYWICKRTPAFVNEAQECLGGAGYIEESILARLYRQAPLNSIWEGSGNIQCLDVLRAMRREPESLQAVFRELESARGGHRALDGEVTRLRDELERAEHLELRARAIVERLAVALQAAVLIKAGNPLVSDAWCSSRLLGRHGATFGTLEADVDRAALIERALPSDAS